MVSEFMSNIIRRQAIVFLRRSARMCPVGCAENSKFMIFIGELVDYGVL